jgi:hypothetical protein
MLIRLVKRKELESLLSNAGKSRQENGTWANSMAVSRLNLKIKAFIKVDTRTIRGKAMAHYHFQVEASTEANT